MHKPKKPLHRNLFPRFDRAEKIKDDLRRQLKDEHEARQAAEAKAEEDRLQAEALAVQLREQADTEEEKRKNKKPWREAAFDAGKKSAPVPEAEAEPLERIEVTDVPKEEDIERGLEAIYVGKDGVVPDLSHLTRRRNTWWLWALGGLCSLAALVGVAAWTGFFLFQPFREFKGDGLRISIDGPKEIALGQEVTYRIKWLNADASPLQRADMRLGLPADFTVTSFTPEPTDKAADAWSLGFQPVGGKGEVIMKGVFAGALGTQSALQVIGSYRPNTFQKDFDVLATIPISYNATVLQGSLSLPEKVIAGDTVTVQYNVSNLGAQAMDGLLAQVQYPDGFIPNLSATSTNVDYTNRTVTFPLADLLPHTTSSVRLTGIFASGVSGDLGFHAETGRRGAGGAFLTAQKTDALVPVLAGDLTLRFVVNGSNTDRTMLPGDPLHVTVGYQNTSVEVIRNVALTVGIESFVDGKSATGTSLVDWTHLEDLSHGVSSTRPRMQMLRFTKNQVPELESLAPQSEGTIEFSLPSLPTASGTRDGAIRFTLTGDVPIVGETKVNRIVRSQPIQARYRSDVDVVVDTHYFTEEGAPIGFGPLPPVAGKTTSYRVTWRLSKTLHPLENLTIGATLPKIVAWSARTNADAGTIRYETSTRQVSWTLNKMPEDVKNLEATFDLELTPEQIDVGRFASLLSETKLDVKDPTVNESITRTKPPLTTDLQNDEGARGKGVVRKE